MNNLDAPLILCLGWSSTDNTSKSANGDSVLARKRRGGQKAPRFDSGLIYQKLDVCQNATKVPVAIQITQLSQLGDCPTSE